MKRELALEMRVMAYREGGGIIEDNDINGKLGVVIGLTDDRVCIEFFERPPMGHDGGGPGGRQGKDGYCWWIDREYCVPAPLDTNKEAKSLLRR